jgi:hypothetical protein
MRAKATDPATHNAHVYLDGVDVSARCSEADDVEGWALLYKVNDDGHKYVEWPPCGHRQRVVGCVCEHHETRAAMERLSGHVEIRLPA